MPTVSDFLVERLQQWGVKRIYGYPGDGINGLMGAMNRAKDNIRFIQTRHEELAAFMACAHAKFTREVGVCMATSGPGAIHLLNGLYDAKADRVPVVAIVGQSPTTAIGADYQQEVDLQSLFKDVAAQYVQTCFSPAAMRHLVDRAFRIAVAERAVTAIIIPLDIQEMDAVPAPPRQHGCVYSGPGYSAPRVLPREDDLARAAAVLNEGKKVAMLIGAGAKAAAGEVLRIAELLQAGIAKALLGKDVLADDLPNVTGSIGLLGTRASYHMMEHCDTLLMVGTSFPYSEFLPKEGAARCVQIDIASRNLSMRYAAEVNLHGDSALTLAGLIPLLKPKERGAWREGIEASIRHDREVARAQAFAPATPINPQRVFWEASSRLPDKAILTADSGTSAIWFARDVQLRQGMMASLSGGLATMCPGVPYALAAKFAFPDRVPVAFVGDGAMQMLGMNSLLDVAKYQHEWTDRRLVVCVLNNSDLNMVSWEQRVTAGEPKFPASQDLPAFDFAAYARQIGLEGIRIEKPEEIGAAWDRAFATDRPCLLDFVTDPNVPPLPPHITYEQAKSMLSSLLHGDPNTAGVTRQSVQQVLAAWLPHLATDKT